MSRGLIASILALALAASGAAPVQAAKPPAPWDNLVLIPSSKIEAVYILPGSDFRGYTKVMMDPTMVAFRKDFQHDYNASTVKLSRRISDADIQRMGNETRADFERIFKESYEKAGYQVVNAAGPDVLRVSTGVLELYFNAPDTMTPDRVRVYSSEAGEATMLIEARDSMTGALLARAIDQRTVGGTRGLRDNISNRVDFGATFRTWARASIDGFAELKARSPIAAAATASR